MTQLPKQQLCQHTGNSIFRKLLWCAQWWSTMWWGSSHHSSIWIHPHI